MRGIRPELLLGLQIVDRVLCEEGIELVLTEATGGVHRPGSLHYVGLAADIRSRDISEDLLQLLAKRMREMLSAEFDVVVEDDHIHLEYQPK